MVAAATAEPSAPSRALPDTAPRDGRLIILPTLKQGGGIQAVDTARFETDCPVQVVADGYWLPDDGGGGTFRWDPASTEMEDGFVIFAPAGAQDTGRWRRIIDPGALSFEMAGAKGDGISDDFLACQRMLLSASRRFHQCRVVLRPGKSYLLDYSEQALHSQATRDNQPGGCSLVIPDHCIIAGPVGALGISASGTPDLAVAAQLILHPRMTIRLAYFAELQDAQIVRKNMQLQADHFSMAGPSGLTDMQSQIDVWLSEDGRDPGVNGGVRSVAITNGGVDTKVHRVLVMGFHTAYLSDGFGRPVVEQLYFDTAGRGIEITRSADDGLVRGCFSNAFWSAGLGSVRNARGDPAARHGIAYDFHDKTDGLRCLDCTACGWKTGLRLSNVWSVTITNLDVEPAEHPPEVVTRGIHAENCVSHTVIMNPLIDGFTYKMDFQHRPLNFTAKTGPGNTAGPGQYGAASIMVIGGSVQGNPSDPPGHRAIRLGPHSAGGMVSVLLAGFHVQPAILVEKDVGNWKFIGVSPSLGDHRPLFEVANHADGPRIMRIACDPIDEGVRPSMTVAGSVILQDLPTSPVGLPAGSLWRDGSTLKVV